MFDIERSKIPNMVKVGDILNITNDEITIDFNETVVLQGNIE